MSKQLTVSAAFSVFMMAAYVLLSVDAVRDQSGRAVIAQNPVEVSAPALPGLSDLLARVR